MYIPRLNEIFCYKPSEWNGHFIRLASWSQAFGIVKYIGILQILYQNYNNKQWHFGKPCTCWGVVPSSLLVDNSTFIVIYEPGINILTAVK